MYTHTVGATVSNLSVVRTNLAESSSRVYTHVIYVRGDKSCD